MQPFVCHTGLVAPLRRDHVDTDMIIPKQFLSSIQRTGFGPFLFDGLRYLDEGALGMDVAARPVNEDFTLNQPRYSGASVLLAGENFGCGSSREHAVWALAEYGFRCVLAPSFADIFYANSVANGLLPVRLAAATTAELLSLTEETPGYQLRVDLERGELRDAEDRVWGFSVPQRDRERLLDGLDDIAVTLRDSEAIRAFEVQRRRQAPWLFGG